MVYKGMIRERERERHTHRDRERERERGGGFKREKVWIDIIIEEQTRRGIVK